MPRDTKDCPERCKKIVNLVNSRSLESEGFPEEWNKDIIVRANS